MMDKPSPLINTTCFICGAPDRTLPRYPVIACAGCKRRAVNHEGKPVKFFNESMSGGFLAMLDDGSRDEETTATHTAYVDGTEVYVDEARFGGTVIQPMDAMPDVVRDRIRRRRGKSEG